MTKVFNPDEYITGEELVENVMKYTEARAVEMRKQLKKDRKAMGISNKLAYAQ